MPLPKNCHTRCDVVLLVDTETGGHSRSGNFVVETGSVEAQVLRALRLQHARVVVVPYDSDSDVTIAQLQKLKPKLVFNLTEWIDGDRSQDYVITRLLKSLDLPYTGTADEGLQLARDKVRAKAVVEALGIATARHFSAGEIGNSRVPYPLFVKPRHGDGSDAISRAALVQNRKALNARVKSLRSRKSGLVLCEEYIEGRDLFVALLGNKPQVMPPLELMVGRQSRGAPRFSTRRLKHDESYARRWKISYRKANLPPSVMTEIRRSSRKIFHALKLRDYARIDYRLTPDNRLVFIEVNPNPDLGRHTFGHNLCFADVNYTDLIRRIVSAARGRFKKK